MVALHTHPMTEFVFMSRSVNLPSSGFFDKYDTESSATIFSVSKIIVFKAVSRNQYRLGGVKLQVSFVDDKQNAYFMLKTSLLPFGRGK